jgi:hypothetical protein
MFCDVIFIQLVVCYLSLRQGSLDKYHTANHGKSYVCVGNECIYANTWHQHDVKIIADFLDEDGNSLLQQGYSQKFRLIDICTVQYI